LHVAECADDLSWRIGLEQLHPLDANACTITIQHILHELQHRLLGLLTC
jgi:hypothetical protein